MNFNKVILGGRLTRDIELRYTPKGTAVGKSSLAINRKWKTESGAEKEEVAFVEFTSWGRTAEVLGQYTGKGSELLIEGRIAQENWEDKQTGQKRSKLVVVVESFQFIGYKSDGEQQGGAAASGGAKAGFRSMKEAVDPASGGAVDAGGYAEDDNVPF